MPWKARSPVDLRMRFLVDRERGFGVSELVAEYGISRKTAYKWMERFAEAGAGGLEDRSHAAHVVANRTPAFIEEMVLQVRAKHASWGPKKILRNLHRTQEGLALPSRSTVAEILKRHGLVAGKPRRRREGHPGRPGAEPERANQIWGADFKGQFKTRDGLYCYPFTVSDLFSRYVICCDGHLSTAHEGVRQSLEIAFRENGMPEAMRTDNGPPFASPGLARLTELSVWLLKLGVRRELIEPGRPTQNGRHERMHRTLKKDATYPPQANLRKQQQAFDDFLRVFNRERPHEAIDMKCPADVYSSSPRPFPEVLPEPEYPGHFEVRRVSRNGGIRWKGQWLNVCHSLIEENVGFEEVEDGIWDAYFMTLRIGRLDERDMRLLGTMGTPRCGKRGNRSSTAILTQGQPRDFRPSHSATTEP